MNETRKKHTTLSLRLMKQRAEKIAMVTAYDAAQAALVEAAGMDVVLVGDSLGMVVLGHDTTIPVTLDDMVHHAKAVRRGAPHTMMLVDMPFLTYHQTISDTLSHAGRLMREALADGVKLEGGEAIVPHVKALVDAGIPVCGHLGLTPQSVLQLGGFHVQGKDEQTAEQIFKDALVLVEAGAFMIVLECVPTPLAKLIREHIPIPTIGIGAGGECDGQVLVYHDLLGISAGHKPKFVKPYADLRGQIVSALETYREEVKGSQFPTPAYSYETGEEAVATLYSKIRGKDQA